MRPSWHVSLMLVQHTVSLQRDFLLSRNEASMTKGFSETNIRLHVKHRGDGNVRATFKNVSKRNQMGAGESIREGGAVVTGDTQLKVIRGC